MSSRSPPSPESAPGPGSGGWWVYMVACADGSLYTGVATDVARRVREHNAGRAGARYTRSRRPVALVYQEALPDRGAALRREAAIKRLSRRAKLGLATAWPERP